MIRSIRTFLRAIALVLLSALVARAETASEFYSGKQIALLVGFGAGGEDDLWAHLIARHLGSRIPGHPAVVPQNTPGSGGLLVANRLFNTSPKDGTVIGMINRGIAFEPLLAGQGTQFDALKLAYLGSPSRDTTVCAARKDAPVRTMADLYQRQLTVGGTGSGADTAVYPEFLSALLGMKFKLIKGYQGSHEIQLAIERGEVQGICVAYDSVSRGSLARAGEMNILLQASLERDPRIVAPVVIEAARSEEDRKSLELFFARTAMGRPFVAPPGVPAERLAMLREAFAATLRDPSFREDAKKQDLNVAPVTAEEMRDVVAKAYAMPSPIIERTIRALGRRK